VETPLSNRDDFSVITLRKETNVMKNVKMLWLAALALIMMAAIAPSASAQNLKIGFVKDDLIKDGYKAWTRAQEQWETERKVWDDAAQAKQTELETMLTDYDKQKLILSDEKRKEREASIRIKKDALDNYTKEIYGPGGKAEQKQETLLGPLLDNVSKAIESIAVEEGYDVIFTLQSGLGYIKETYDVTAKVLERLEKLGQ